MRPLPFFLAALLAGCAAVPREPQALPLKDFNKAVILTEGLLRDDGYSVTRDAPAPGKAPTSSIILSAKRVQGSVLGPALRRDGIGVLAAVFAGDQSGALTKTEVKVALKPLPTGLSLASDCYRQAESGTRMGGMPMPCPWGYDSASLAERLTQAYGSESASLGVISLAPTPVPFPPAAAAGAISATPKASKPTRPRSSMLFGPQGNATGRP